MSRVIPGADATHARPWHIPDVESVDLNAGAHFTSSDTPQNKAEAQYQQQEAEHVRGYNEGFEQGYREGKQAADEQLVADREKLLLLLNFLSRPVEALEQQVEHELLELSLAIAKQILKREVSAQPMHIMGLIRTSVARLPVAENDITVQLNPADAKVIRQALQTSENPQRWKLVEDPGLSQGSCNVSSESSYVDGSVDAMVTQMAVDLFGGQRGADQGRDADKARTDE